MTENACVFCDRAQFEERLIAEDKHFYLVATLGQITNGGYLLLIPKRHMSCLAAMDEDEMVAVPSAVGVVRKAIWKEYGSGITFFEHGIVGQTIKHAHLHIMPGSYDFSQKLRADFANKLFLHEQSWSRLGDIYERTHEPYLLCSNNFVEAGLVTIENGFLVCVNPEPPVQYFRTALAGMLNCPERANWRNMDPVLDRKLWSETVTRLKSYFLGE